MPAKSKAQWRYLFSNLSRSAAKRRAQGEGKRKVTYKSLPERSSR